MQIHIELNEEDLKMLVHQEIQRRMGEFKLPLETIKIEVKSKQNYKSEWERAAFRAQIDYDPSIYE